MIHGRGDGGALWSVLRQAQDEGRLGVTPIGYCKQTPQAFFVHGFAKSDQSDIRDDELAAFRMLAAQLLTYSEAEIAAAVEAGALKEVPGNDETIRKQGDGFDP